MAETGSNIEFAHRIHEQGHHGGGSHPHAHQWIEILEAIVLAAVAVLTAWSGYQAAKWDARSAAAYAMASQTTTQAQEQQTLAGQDHLYDIIALNTWINATRGNDKAFAALVERRFRPEYEVAFRAWIKTDPLNNPNAPLGPALMPEYRSAKLEKARALNEESSRQFRQGVDSRETGDRYVRITVLLATVLLLTALAQRFKIHAARVGLLAVASIMLVRAVSLIVSFPRA